MDCVGCGSAAVTERPDLTAQGYRRFRCRDCGRQFNERSDGVLNRASLPSDIIAFVVFCRLRYRLTLRDLSEIMLLRGFTVSHECVRQWEAKLLPVMGEALRKRRHGTGRSSGQSWYVDETYLKVQGRWCYLYRAIDRDGNLIDTMLSATRDMRAAQRFFRSARSVAGFVPDRVTTDGHNSYPRAIRSTLGRKVRHRTSVYLNNRLEQDHRGIKGRIRCMRGFKEHDAADRFCREHDELRNFLRSRSRHNQYVPAARRRRHFLHHRSHRDRHHADRMIRKFTTRAPPQTARGVTEPSPLFRADFGPALTVPAVVLAVLPARLEIAAPAPPQRAEPDRARCRQAYLCGLRHPRRASSGPGSQPGRDDRSRSRHHRVGAAEVWLTIAHLDHQSEN